MYKTIKQILIEHHIDLEDFTAYEYTCLQAAMKEASEQAFNAARSVKLSIVSNGVQSAQRAPSSATYPSYKEFELDRLC